MNLGPKLAEGKTKIIYAHPDDPTLAVVLHKDSISAGDGARRHIIPGKGASSGRTTANVFALLNRAGIATHFVAAPEPTILIVRRCAMLPIEVVMRRIPAGSYLRRNPHIAPDTHFDPPLVELFFKDDAHHDPQMTPDEIVARGIATSSEVERIVAVGRLVFTVLEQAWEALEVTLVDLKIEFGRDAGGSLLVADVIDNDSWRIWPGGVPSRMLDKQVYRDMREVTTAGLADVQRLYETVAALTDVWS